MKRNFEFNYYFNEVDFSICNEYGITKTDIENKIKDYIIRYKFFIEYDFLAKFNDTIAIDFTIANITDGKFTIDVDNLYIID